jgi:iron(III) transport system permease protein
VAATAWSILLGPQNGVLNVLWHDATGLDGFNVYSMAGMILIQSLYLVPLVYLMVAASFRSINPELEEASRTAGASAWSTFVRITIGVCRPAVLSAAVLCFIIGIASMEIPLIFGFPGRVYVFTSNIYSALRVRFPPEYGPAAAMAVALLVVALGVLWAAGATAPASSTSGAGSGRRSPPARSSSCSPSCCPSSPC